MSANCFSFVLQPSYRGFAPGPDWGTSARDFPWTIVPSKNSWRLHRRQITLLPSAEYDAQIYILCSVLNHSPTFSTVRVSFDTRYLLSSFCNNTVNFPSDEFLYQADTLAVGLAATHLIDASSDGLLSLTLTGVTDAETSHHTIVDQNNKTTVRSKAS